MKAHVSDEPEGQVVGARTKWKDFTGQGELWEDTPHISRRVAWSYLRFYRDKIRMGLKSGGGETGQEKRSPRKKLM